MRRAAAVSGEIMFWYTVFSGCAPKRRPIIGSGSGFGFGFGGLVGLAVGFGWPVAILTAGAATWVGAASFLSFAGLGDSERWCIMRVTSSSALVSTRGKGCGFAVSRSTELVFVDDFLGFGFGDSDFLA